MNITPCSLSTPYSQAQEIVQKHFSPYKALLALFEAGIPEHPGLIAMKEKKFPYYRLQKIRVLKMPATPPKGTGIPTLTEQSPLYLSLGKGTLQMSAFLKEKCPLDARLCLAHAVAHEKTDWIRALYPLEVPPINYKGKALSLFEFTCLRDNKKLAHTLLQLEDASTPKELGKTLRAYLKLSSPEPIILKTLLQKGAPYQELGEEERKKIEHYLPDAFTNKVDQITKDLKGIDVAFNSDTPHPPIFSETSSDEETVPLVSKNSNKQARSKKPRVY